MSEYLITLGWRRVGRRVIATEAFCNPPHTGVIAELRAITPEVVMLGDALRWGMSKQGKLQPLDALKGVHPGVDRRVGELADIVHDAIAHHLEDVMTLETAEVVNDVRIMFTEHPVERDALFAAMVPEHEQKDDALLAFEIDRGSPITQVGDNTYPTLVEKQVSRGADGRLVKIAYPVRNLPPAAIRWNEKLIVTLPGVPLTSPLAGWRKPEEMLVRVLSTDVYRAVRDMHGMR